MEAKKKNNLVKQGWKTSTVADFLDLTSEETAIIETKLALSRHLFDSSLFSKI